MTETYTLGTPFIDLDEQRDAPMPHRYVHGGFEGNETRFSFYFPPAETYQKRFLHLLEGGLGGNENTAQSPAAMGGTIAFAFQCGSYLVESNQGHVGADMSGSGGDERIHAYVASAESARFARELATEMYGSRPERGYVFGGSGGGHRAILCLENGEGVWDGAVPFILGLLNAQWVVWSVVAHAMLELGPNIHEVIDAMEPGGSGDPFVPSLSTAQREALATLYRLGFPRGAEPALLYHFEAVTLSCWAWHAPTILEFDPKYFEEDFWSLPGYAGFDSRAAIERHLIDEKVTVTRVLRASELKGFSLNSSRDPEAVMAIGIDREDMDSLIGARITVTSGEEAGRQRYCIGVNGDLIQSTTLSNDLWGHVAVGDEIHIDNRPFLAYCYWHRHQSGETGPDRDRLPFGELYQFSVDGNATYPQRPIFAHGSHNLIEKTGNFTGKMILIQNCLDAAAWPNPAFAYQRKAQFNYGEDVDHHFRLWWTANASHLPPSLATTMLPPTPPPVRSTRLVDFDGVIQQALRDLIAWVESGIDPPASSSVTYSHDHGLEMAESAAERHGIQAVVSMLANGERALTVPAGSDVTLEATVECPEEVGSIIRLEWDFDGTGTYGQQYGDLDGTQSSLQVSTTNRYETPGKYIAAVRVTTHREGQLDATTCLVRNLGRVRVTVN